MKCLDSLRPQGVEWQLILTANGKKLSPELLSKLAEINDRYILLETEEILPPGRARNLALERAEGEWIFFLDDDAVVLPGYWDVAIAHLGDPKIDVLGGPDSPVRGMKPFPLSLALALSSPFCTGTTFSRHKADGKRLQEVDEEKLTSCNLWIKKAALGDVKFPEDYFRAEETVFLQKLQKMGRHMFYHPRLQVGHHRRSHLKELLRPGFNAGFYRSKLMRKKLKKGNEIFWLPSVFVLLHLVYFFDPVSFWYMARMYVSIILFVSIGLAMQARRLSLFPLIAFLHYFIVFLYGTGFLAERLNKWKK